VLYVTEKMANKIATFKVNNHGVASAGAFHESVGQTPFGFDFSRNANYLIVSNAAGGAPNASSCTSYSTDRWGNINNINGAVPDFQSAACWVATTYHGRFAFVTNTGSNSISSYYVSPFGGLYLIFFTITPTGKAPIDITVSGDNYYVYNINAGSHTIGEYKRGSLGTLNKIGHVPDLPPYASGLAAY
jgi:6-phosphogluconolactonase (cycloisomerase 2 family)